MEVVGVSRSCGKMLARVAGVLVIAGSAAAPAIRGSGAVFCDPTVEWDPNDPQCPAGNACPDACPELATSGLCRCPCPLPYIMERLQNVGRICCADSELCVNTFHPYEDSCDPTVRTPSP